MEPLIDEFLEWFFGMGVQRNSLVDQSTKCKGSPVLLERVGVPELIPVLSSQPAGDIVINPAVGCHYFPLGPRLPLQYSTAVTHCILIATKFIDPGGMNGLVGLITQSSLSLLISITYLLVSQTKTAICITQKNYVGKHTGNNGRSIKPRHCYTP